MILFKVTKPEYTNKTFRMPNDLISKLEKLAQEKQVSLNQLVIQCCNYALDNLEE
jgi:predicted HicB family RNase H-like nuclease